MKRRFYLVASAISIIVFISFFLATVLGFFTLPDAFIAKNFYSLRGEFLNNLAIFFTYFFNFGFFLLIWFVTIFFIREKRIENAFLFFSVFVLSFVLEILIKAAVRISRPDEALIQTLGYAFPSGHATISAAITFSLIYLFPPYLKNKKHKIIFIACAIFVPIFVGATRLYLNVHQLSEVLAGLTLGIFVSSSVIFIYEKNKKNKK